MKVTTFMISTTAFLIVILSIMLAMILETYRHSYSEPTDCSFKMYIVDSSIEVFDNNNLQLHHGLVSIDLPLAMLSGVLPIVRSGPRRGAVFFDPARRCLSDNQFIGRGLKMQALSAGLKNRSVCSIVHANVAMLQSPSCSTFRSSSKPDTPRSPCGEARWPRSDR